jgi:MFS family permease
MLAVAHSQPWQFLVAASLLGVGIGLAFAALGNLIVQAVPSHQTGVASGVNTVMRTLGGALGGQLSATFIAGHMSDGLPTVTGFTETFVMATGFLVLCFFMGLLVPKALGGSTASSVPQVAPPEGAQA